jgi:hypothetical protein
MAVYPGLRREFLTRKDSVCLRRDSGTYPGCMTQVRQRVWLKALLRLMFPVAPSGSPIAFDGCGLEELMLIEDKVTSHSRLGFIGLGPRLSHRPTLGRRWISHASSRSRSRKDQGVASTRLVDNTKDQLQRPNVQAAISATQRRSLQ